MSVSNLLSSNGYNLFCGNMNATTLSTTNILLGGAPLPSVSAMISMAPGETVFTDNTMLFGAGGNAIKDSNITLTIDEFTEETTLTFPNNSEIQLGPHTVITDQGLRRTDGNGLSFHTNNKISLNASLGVDMSCINGFVEIYGNNPDNRLMLSVNQANGRPTLHGKYLDDGFLDLQIGRGNMTTFFNGPIIADNNISGQFIVGTTGQFNDLFVPVKIGDSANRVPLSFLNNVNGTVFNCSTNYNIGLNTVLHREYLKIRSPIGADTGGHRITAAADSTIAYTHTLQPATGTIAHSADVVIYSFARDSGYVEGSTDGQFLGDNKIRKVKIMSINDAGTNSRFTLRDEVSGSTIVQIDVVGNGDIQISERSFPDFANLPANTTLYTTQWSRTAGAGLFSLIGIQVFGV